MKRTTYQPEPREAELIRLIADLHALSGHDPYQPQLAEGLGVSVPTIYIDLRVLRAAGYVQPGDRPGGVALTELGRAFAERSAAPINSPATPTDVNTSTTLGGEAW